MPTERVEDLFLDSAIQYYVAARTSVLAGLLPVCGNLFHHAIEAQLKARLSQTHTLEELKQKFGHKLPKLWRAFKVQFPKSDLRQFDDLIADLDKFEKLRYPDAVLAEGASMLVGRFHTSPQKTSATQYQIDLPNIDRCFANIFEVCSRNPLFFTNRLNEYARDAITRNNPLAEKLVRARAKETRLARSLKPRRSK
jgi:hypothetical protein